MTEYEKFSLSLLSHIVSGINLQLSSPKPLPLRDQDHQKLVLEWSEILNGVLEEVSVAIRTE
ncbi:MAG: hypothetical protein IH991_25460 [Planctomycetes bacterium]|nr:hypothetical protein [Planctomycetota bacterium]